MGVIECEKILPRKWKRRVIEHGRNFRVDMEHIAFRLSCFRWRSGDNDLRNNQTGMASTVLVEPAVVQVFFCDAR
jgi:hypothetical protein